MFFTHPSNNTPPCFGSDSLVLHLQLLHDGHLPGGSGEYDSHEDSEEGLRQVQQGGRAG